jgi:hypothetical protein
MHIQVNTDSNIEGRETLAAQVMGTAESTLSRFNDHITRVEMHLSDENGDKSGQSTFGRPRKERVARLTRPRLGQNFRRSDEQQHGEPGPKNPQ